MRRGKERAKVSSSAPNSPPPTPSPTPSHAQQIQTPSNLKPKPQSQSQPPSSSLAPAYSHLPCHNLHLERDMIPRLLPSPELLPPVRPRHLPQLPPVRERGDGDERRLGRVEGEAFRLEFSFGSGDFELAVESHLVGGWVRGLGALDREVEGWVGGDGREGGQDGDASSLNRKRVGTESEEKGNENSPWEAHRCCERSEGSVLRSKERRWVGRC